MTEIEEAIKYLTPISKHPTMTGNYCKYLVMAIESLKCTVYINQTLKREGFDDIETMISQYKQILRDANEIEIEKDETIERLSSQLAQKDGEIARQNRIISVSYDSKFEMLSAESYLLSELDRLTAENAELRSSLEKEMEQNRWIPIKERLPKINTRVLIRICGDVDIAYRNKTISGKILWCDDECYPYSKNVITHWRSLPEPPKGD